MTEPGGVTGATWVWFGRDRMSTGRPDGRGIAAPQLGWVGFAVAVAVGVLLAVLAVRVATAALPSAFRAQATVAIVPDSRVVPDPDDAGPDWDEQMAEFAGSEQAARTAAAVLEGVPVNSATVSATGAPGSVSITVTAGSAAAAERAAQDVLDRGIPVTEPLAGQVRLVPKALPAGTAVTTGLPPEMVLAAAAPAGFLLGVLLVLTVRWTALRVRVSRPRP